MCTCTCVCIDHSDHEVKGQLGHQGKLVFFPSHVDSRDPSKVSDRVIGSLKSQVIMVPEHFLKSPQPESNSIPGVLPAPHLLAMDPMIQLPTRFRVYFHSLSKTLELLRGAVPGLLSLNPSSLELRLLRRKQLGVGLISIC